LTALLASLLLPVLFWDKGPETAQQLTRAHIQHVAVPEAALAAWKSVTGLSVESVDTGRLIKLLAPGVTMRAREASATRAPWVNSNGWKFVRQPDGRFFYDVAGKGAALAAAEAFAFGANAVIRTDEAGLPALGQMLQYLERAGQKQLPVVSDIGFLDDGSPASGEFLNLMIRRNLLVRLVRQPDSKLPLTVQLGSPDYPKSEASDPKLLAEKARAHLTDEKRSLRIYGSEVTVGRLSGNEKEARLFLLNYGVQRTPVNGLRVRVAGVYPKVTATQFDATDTKLLDVCIDKTGTEFTLPQLETFAIIDLTH
jgi:hypothetical protein